MSKFARLQVLGPLVVFVTVFIAEAAAFALSRWPASELLWRVNLEFFGVLQKSQYLLGPTSGVPFSQLVVIAVPLLAVAIFGVLSGHDLALAVASNLSLVYTAFLILAGMSSRPHSLAASVAGIAVPGSPGSYIPLVLVGVSLVSAAIAHAGYFRKICAERLAA
jgi:hypothetical protein